MEIRLYNTTDSNNTINKKLTGEKIYNVIFKDNANIINPTIKIRTNDIITFNYAYIPTFNRYYFINDIDIEPNRITTLKLDVDVLESFKDDILLCDGVITRSDTGNPYYDGGDYESEVKTEHYTYTSGVNLIKGDNTIMVMTGVKKVDNPI